MIRIVSWLCWWYTALVWGVCRGSVSYEQWLNPLRLDERAQSQSTGCLSSHWGWAGQERIETHVNTVCVCVCVCVCVNSISVRAREVQVGAHQKSLSIALYLSFLFSPQVMKACFIQRPPFSSQTAASQRALIILNFFPLSLASFVFLSISHPLSSILNPSNQRCPGRRWGCHSQEEQHCS